MPNPGSIIGAITEELGETAKQVVKQTAQVPKDVAAAALESLGGSSGKKQGSSSTSSAATPKPAHEATALDEFSSAQDPRTRKEIARNALRYLAGEAKQKEPGVGEQHQREQEEKKKQESEQKEKVRKQTLPLITTKPRRGNLYGVTKSKAGSETSRNVRQD